MSDFLERLNQAHIELAQHDADPLREKVEAIVRGMEAVSTVALLDLLGLPKTIGNGRRIAPSYALLGLYPDQVAPSHARGLP